ncbi:BTAD domain-containing putative transcriptional regulator, partial [Actinoallomurus acaciae]
MRVGILGPLDVTAEGRSVNAGGPRLRALLIRLALDAGRTVPAAALADEVWPDDGPVDRVNALQSLVARLRRLLPGDVLLSTGGGYRLDLSADAVDACRFEGLAGEGRRALKDGEPEVALRVLDEALGLWRGELTDGAPDTARRRLDELRLGAQEDRAEAALAVGRLDGIVAELRELTATYPFRERLRVLIVRTLTAEGRQAEALAFFAEYPEFLADEVGADPGPELLEAHQAALAGGPAPAKRPRGNLRAPVTGLIGRAEEVALVHGRLGTTRLVTLVGPGGVGKTRLATAVAAERSPDAWLVELASVTDSGALARAVLDALGIGGTGMFDGPRDDLRRLSEALTGDETLVVLDNCEHLVDDVAPFVQELLGRCPGLRVIATSREPLGVLGEAICPVPPLPMEFAVRLFGDRAAAARPGFVLTAGNAPLVEDLCRRLDGLPLALELAAARLRSLPLTDLAARLDARLDLPAYPRRATEPRHRTLRAVVAWSWDLLGDDERRLARRLAAFPGGISVESAESVAAADVDVLTALADRSLLQFDGERYRMLETIREYGLEQLVHSGELARVQAAHAAYFVGLAERAEPCLRDARQLPWLARLAAERDNLFAALRFARQTGDVGVAVLLCAALGVFWLIRGDVDAMAR